MKYYYRCWLWEKGQKSTEYTDYMVAPFFYEDNLDDTLDTAEIILDNMPIATKNAFPPKSTKFRVERYKTADFSDIPTEDDKWDLIVEADNVEEYPGLSDICCHRINCIEASAYAQGVHVDNFALTYELQDVKMNYKTITVNSDTQDAQFKNDKNRTAIKQSSWYINTSTLMGYTASTTFLNSYAYEWDETTFEANEDNPTPGISDIITKRHIDSNTKYDLTFKIPKLYCLGASGNGEWVRLFEMNTLTRIYRYTIDPQTRQTIESSKTLVAGPIIGGDTSFDNASDINYVIQDNKAYIREIQDVDKGENGWGGVTISFADWIKDTSDMTPVAVASATNVQEFTYETETLDTSLVDENNNKINYGYRYEIETVAYSQNMPYQYKKIAKQTCTNVFFISTFTTKMYTEIYDQVPDQSKIIAKNYFQLVDSSQSQEGSPYLSKGVSYNAYQLFRKAMLTTDTQIIDNSKCGLDNKIENGAEEEITYPIFVEEDIWLDKLINCTIFETIFEQKNLWEIFLQIGYYLHAVPYLKFAEDGTDRFVLCFKQLGDVKSNTGDTTKITIYNSRNLSEYFTAFDSYVTNMFSPQNLVEEWLVPKTSDSGYLISNGTAELHCSKPITEIVEFDITYNGKTKSALSSIFEESVYQVLTTENPDTFSPSKGRSIYYKQGDNKILGLTYVSPSVDSDNYYALKYIIKYLFSLTPTQALNLEFNKIIFHIKYRTQDSMRVSQVRPDIDRFIKNSEYEKYPHNEQYFGQQDKIVDSERFGSNLWGKLVRTGNNIYQRQEYAENVTDEKVSGQMVNIGDDTYYVTKVENEYYNDATFQKVTYSKNFNQISQIVTIPSEPRFYEVSEKSNVRREVRMMEFLKIGIQEQESVISPRYIRSDLFEDFVKNNIFNCGERYLPSFAFTRFLADDKRKHTDSKGWPQNKDELFPSSEIDRTTDPNNYKPKDSSNKIDTIVPAIHYPFRNSLVFEWDMVDNFKAGDFVDTGAVAKADISNTGDDAYYALQPLRYCDILGRADLFQFKLTDKKGLLKEGVEELTIEQLQSMPKCETIPSDSDCPILLYEEVDGVATKAIGLDKDCREALSFNMQINLVYNNEDGFIIYPNIWGVKSIASSRLKMCLCDKKRSLFDDNVNVMSSNENKIIAYVDYSIQDVNGQLQLVIDDSGLPADFDKSQIGSIVLYDEDEKNRKFAYIVRNVDNVPDDEKLINWYIYPIFNEN